MSNTGHLNIIISEIYHFSRETFGNKLVDVILFGSYARGDYDQESDIDIMILVDMEKEKLKNYMQKYSLLAADLCLEYEILVSPILQSDKFFKEWLDYLPFYQNVNTEGVRISA
jgi:predicted nucleotidyltransferase